MAFEEFDYNPEFQRKLREAQETIDRAKIQLQEVQKPLQHQESSSAISPEDRTRFDEFSAKLHATSMAILDRVLEKNQSPQVAVRNSRDATLTTAPGAKPKLPPKKGDFSRYFDQAKLTNRQRDCISLKLEYGFTITAISKRLGIDRKTVSEHIEAAERNMQHAKALLGRQKQRARQDPHE